ncbi:MAG: hypothetical protein C0200_00630 [Thermoproteota archaeon]|nr:MAG: hypothetical protein C0200_00630 [Candidatus Korarchaeota archaeon]
MMIVGNKEPKGINLDGYELYRNPRSLKELLEMLRKVDVVVITDSKEADASLIAFLSIILGKKVISTDKAEGILSDLISK